MIAVLVNLNLGTNITYHCICFFIMDLATLHKAKEDAIVPRFIDTFIKAQLFLSSFFLLKFYCFGDIFSVNTTGRVLVPFY